MRIFEIETEEIYSADYSGCFPVSNPADLSDDNALYDGAIYAGILHQTGEKAFADNPNLSVPLNFYFCIDKLKII